MLFLESHKGFPGQRSPSTPLRQRAFPRFHGQIPQPLQALGISRNPVIVKMSPQIEAFRMTALASCYRFANTPNVLTKSV